LERIPHTSKRNANLLKANLHFESHLHVPKESIDLKVAWNLNRNATWHHRPRLLDLLDLEKHFSGEPAITEEVGREPAMGH
jgi:hypothetical protein